MHLGRNATIMALKLNLQLCVIKIITHPCLVYEPGRKTIQFYMKSSSNFNAIMVAQNTNALSSFCKFLHNLISFFDYVL